MMIFSWNNKQASTISCILLLLYKTSICSSSTLSNGCPPAGASSPTVTGEKTTLFIDLSYQPRLDATTLSAAVNESILRRQHHTIEIDFSSSLIGDDGLEHILKSSLFKNKVGDNRTTTINLALRTNQLTSTGASKILKNLLQPIEGKKQNLTATKESKSGGDDGDETALGDRRRWYVKSLDLSWNDLNAESSGFKSFASALRTLLEDKTNCPRILSFDRCSMGPAACRSIGKGLMNRFNNNQLEGGDTTNKPLSLHLCGNDQLADSGVVTLAAALKRITNSRGAVFDVLDLSACNIGDVGAEAIAIALEHNPGCIRHLDLSNNHISSAGATAIGNALSDTNNADEKHIEKVILDHNNIGDHGAAAMANALSNGNIRNMSLRSCSIHADGAMSFGRALRQLSFIRGNGNICRPIECVNIDLSGNPLGVLRPKKKTSLKTKASETTSSYMNFLGKQIRSGLKDVGLDSVLNNAASAESDDEEEQREGFEDEDDNTNPNKNTDSSKARCGAKAFADAILEEEENNHNADNTISTTSAAGMTKNIRCNLGMRHCFLDLGATDALAATKQHAKKEMNIDLSIDTHMNHVLEDNIVDALMWTGVESDGSDSYLLEEMAERYIDIMEKLRVAEERAAAAAHARSRSISSGSRWDDGNDDEEEYGGVDYEGGDYDNDFDSDAEYDDLNDEY